jgi:hypothetical protein
MTFSTNTMERERMLRYNNSHQSFKALPLKPNGQCTRSNPTQSSNLQAWIAQWRSPVEPSETRHYSQIDQDMHPADHHLGATRKPRTTTIYSIRARRGDDSPEQRCGSSLAWSNHYQIVVQRPYHGWSRSRAMNDRNSVSLHSFSLLGRERPGRRVARCPRPHRVAIEDDGSRRDPRPVARLH